MRVSRSFTFEAAHRLEEYAGKCESLHGHTWRIEVTLEGPVGPDGIAFDFALIEREMRQHVLSHLDHQYLNDLLPVPSAERVALWAWDRLSHLPVAEIRIWETPDCAVAYDGRDR